MARVTIIGDIHGELTRGEVSQLNDSDRDLLLLTGDLASLFRKPKAPGAVADVAEALSELDGPALVILGNHDGATLPQLVAEASRRGVLTRATGLGMEARVDRLERVISRRGTVTVCGYSSHSFDFGGPGGRFDVIAGRPHSMGGPELAFRSLLETRYGVETMEGSARRLVDLVERSEAEALLFLSHNGPTGLGSRPEDIWGRDFGDRDGDWGDPDLERAVARARALGKKVVAVVAGHMHLAVIGGGERPWRVERDGVLYINAARVPRVLRRGGQLCFHSVELVWDGEEATAREIFEPLR